MNRFGSNSYDDDNEHYEDNQRVGRRLADNNPRPWNEQGRGHHIPDNRHGSSPNYRPDHAYQNRSGNYDPNQNRNQYGGRGGENPFTPGHPEDSGYRHHDDSIWTERNDFKDRDFRYRSGNRNYWHEDYDNQYEGRQHRPHPDNFFSNIGQGIREGWHNLTNRNHDDDNRHRENRHYERGGNFYTNNRGNDNDSRTNPRSDEWKNSGPDYRDETFLDSRNFKL